MAIEYYEALGGRNGLMVAMHRALDDLRKFPYFGFVPRHKRADAIERLAEAIQLMETHEAMEFLSTRLLFPVMEQKDEVNLIMFLQRENFYRVHEILFADHHSTSAMLFAATKILYPEVLMDLRMAYNNSRFNPGTIENYFSTVPAPLGES